MTKVILPDGYKPQDDEEYMNPSQLEYFKQKLLLWREELLEESRKTLDTLQKEEWNAADFNDRASVVTEVAIELRTRDRYLRLIKKIDDALKRIENNTYGYCAVTGDEIGIKRLEARPVATLCTDAQDKYEKLKKNYRKERDY